MPTDGNEARAEVGRLLLQRPPLATTFCIERFMRIPPRGLGAEVLDQLIADGGTGEQGNLRPGRALRWRDAQGRDLAGFDVHPVRQDFEDALLPHVFAAVAGAPLVVELRCDSRTVLDGRVVVERWDGRELLGQQADGAMAPGTPTPSDRAILARLEAAGCRVATDAGAIAVTREQVSPARPWMLALLPLVIVASPVLLLLARQVLWGFFDRALRTRRSSFSLRLEPRRVSASVEGDGEAGERVEIDAADIVAVSFAPRGCLVGDRVRGVLRAVGRSTVVHVPVDLPDLPHATQREIGGALKGLLEAAAVRARALEPEAPR